MIELILLERVENLGQMGQVVKVRPGFARNFLLPQKKALRATKDNLAFFEKQRTQLEAQNLKKKGEAEQVAGKLEGVNVVVIRQAGESGQLYGSVSARDIADAVTAAGFTVGRSQIVLDKPIKSLGHRDRQCRAVTGRGGNAEARRRSVEPRPRRGRARSGGARRCGRSRRGSGRCRRSGTREGRSRSGACRGRKAQSQKSKEGQGGEVTAGHALPSPSRWDNGAGPRSGHLGDGRARFQCGRRGRGLTARPRSRHVADRYGGNVWRRRRRGSCRA